MAKPRTAKRDTAPATPEQPAPVSTSAAEWVDASTLVPWSKNPRQNDAAARELADSLIRFGWGAVLIVRAQDSRIVAGHARLKAVKLLPRLWSLAGRRGIPKRETWHPEAVRTLELGLVPVRRKELTEREADLLALADNRLGETADWDDQALADILADFSESEAALAGWDTKDLDKLFDEDADELSAAPKALPLTYSLVVECNDEQHQAQLLERFEAEGLRVKPLAT